MKFSQLLTAPNQLTLLRMAFLPFIVIHLVYGRYWAGERMHIDDATFAQVAALFFVMLLLVYPVVWVNIAAKTFLRATFIFTIVSGLHYALLVGQRLRAHAAGTDTPPVSPS